MLEADTRLSTTLDLAHCHAVPSLQARGIELALYINGVLGDVTILVPEFLTVRR